MAKSAGLFLPKMPSSGLGDPGACLDTKGHVAWTLGEEGSKGTIPSPCCPAEAASLSSDCGAELQSPMFPEHLPLPEHTRELTVSQTHCY